MHKEEVTIEGLHVEIQTAWTERIDREVKHLEAQHPGVFTRIAVRFTPIKPHHKGMSVSIDGRVDLKPFHVEREGTDVLAVLHEAFNVVTRSLQDRAKRGHNRDVGVVPTEMAAEEDLMDADTASHPAAAE